MSQRYYTNTGKVSHIAGLLVTTVLVSYAATHSTEIVNGAVAIVKKGYNEAKKAVEKVNTVEKQVWSTDINGVAYFTGKTVRVKK